MASLWRALALCFTLLGAAVAADTLSFAPRDGILVLRNGFVLSGRITPLGETYLVSFGERGEARIPRREVEFDCANLEEAYLLKRDSLEGDDAKSHLQLADWCLRHGLFARAADQLLVVRMKEPKHPVLPALERRLETMASIPSNTQQANSQQVARKVEKRPTTVAVATSADQEIPPYLLQQFTVTVQPILLNRCAAHACHGAASTNEYRLIRPSQGSAITSRLTHRNLSETLDYINKQDPNSSLLLEMAKKAHGGAETNGFQDKYAGQLDVITNWVRRLGVQLPESAMAKRSQPVQTPEKMQTTEDPSQPFALPATATRGAKRDVSQAGFVDQQPSLPLVQPGNSPLPSTSSVNDPLDPAEFNRRFHP